MDAISPRSLIEGISISPLKVIEDKRGAVLHMLRADHPEFMGFGECYFSEVLPGAVKAWKRHTQQTQNLAVPTGMIRLVIFDDRSGSSSFQQFQVLDLGRPDCYYRICIPPMLWYGFSNIGTTSALMVNCTNMPHDPQESITMPADDPYFPYVWHNLSV